ETSSGQSRTAGMRSIPLALAAACVLSSSAAAQGGFIPPASKDLIAVIAQKDKALFDAVFETCDTTALSALVAEDFEFYHDKFGKVTDSGSAWVKSIGEMCERQRKGTDYRARRELDSASVKVYPINK